MGESDRGVRRTNETKTVVKAISDIVAWRFSKIETLKGRGTVMNKREIKRFAGYFT